MNGLYHTYYQLLRFLICPTRFLWVLFIFSLFTVVLVPLLLLLGAPEWVEAFYIVAAMLVAMILLSLQPNLSLLASRKAIALCGNVRLHLGVLATLLILFAAMVVAPLLASPFDNMANYARATLLFASGLLLIITLGLRSGFNLISMSPFLVGPLVLIIARIDTFVPNLDSWVQRHSPGLYLFALIAAFLWFMLCRQLHQGRLFKLDVIWHLCLDKDNSGRHVPAGIFNDSRTLKIQDDPVRNRSVLLLESNFYLRDYLYTTAMFAAPLFLGFYLLRSFGVIFADVSSLTVFALIIVFAPMLAGATSLRNIATNMRRLWLVVPGGREQHLVFLERQLLKWMLLAAITTWLPAAALLAVDGLPPLWVAAFFLVLGAAVCNCTYTHFMTVTQDSIGLLVFRIFHTLFTPALVALCWFWRDPVLPALIGVVMCALCLGLRNQLYSHWSAIDMSRLRGPAIGTRQGI